MSADLEELLNAPEVRLLDTKEREPLIEGMKRLAAADKPAAELFLLLLGTGALMGGHAAVVGKYARYIGNLLDRQDYDFKAVGMPLVWAVAAPQLPGELGVAAFPAVERYARQLFEALRFARALGQPPQFFSPFSTPVLGISSKAQGVKHAIGMFKPLYELDAQTASEAASVVALLWRYGDMPGTVANYLSILATAVEKLGTGHKVVKALVDKNNAEAIVNKLGRYPQFPFIFGSTVGTPISPSFYLVAGDTFAEMKKAAKAQEELLHQNHFDVELALVERSMDDIVRKMNLSQRKKIGLLDACTGDGTKLVQAMMRLARSMYDNKVEGTVLSGVCLVDYNEYLLLDAIAAIESLGIAVRGTSTSTELFHSVISKALISPERPKEKKEIPVLDLTLCGGNIESIVKDEGFQDFRRQFPFYLTTLLGTTICNFDPDAIARTLHEVTSEYCLVSVYFDEGNDEKLRGIYGSDAVRTLSANNLRIAGVDPADFGKFDYKVDVQRWMYEGKNYTVDPLVAVVTYFEARERVKGRLFDLENGERAPGLLSIKPTDSQFRTIVQNNGFDVAGMYMLEDVGLYLLRKLTTAGSLSVHGSRISTHSQR